MLFWNLLAFTMIQGMLAISPESLSLSYHPLNSKGCLLTQLSDFFFRKPKPRGKENALCSSTVMLSQSVLYSAAQTLALPPWKFSFFHSYDTHAFLYFWLIPDSEILVHYFLILISVYLRWDRLRIMSLEQ